MRFDQVINPAFIEVKRTIIQFSLERMTEDYEPFSELLQVKNPELARHYVQIIKAKRFNLWYDWIATEMISQKEFDWRQSHGLIAESSSNPEYRIFSRDQGAIADFEADMGPKLLQFAAQMRQLARGASLQLDTGEEQLFVLAKIFRDLDPWVIEALLIANRNLNDHCSKREFWDQLLVDIGFKKQKLISNLMTFYLETRRRMSSGQMSHAVIVEHINLDQPLESLRGHAMRIAEFNSLLEDDQVELHELDETDWMSFTVRLTRDGIDMV